MQDASGRFSGRKRLDLAQFQGYTPGPWRLGSRINGGDNIHGPVDGVYRLAHVGSYERIGKDAEEDAPNARLIAAAPAILAYAKQLEAALQEACEGLNAITDNCEHWTLAQTAGHAQALRVLIEQMQARTVLAENEEK